MLLSDWTDVAVGLLLALLVRRVVALGAAFVVARDGDCVLETVLGMFLLWAVDFVFVLLSPGCVVDLSTEDRRFVVSDVDVGSISDGLTEAAELSVGLSVDC